MTLSLIILTLMVGCGLTVFIFVKTKSERVKHLFREYGVAIKKQDGGFEYPKFKKSKNKLILQRYNSAFTTKDIDTKMLIALSKVLCSENEEYIFAEYEKANFLEHLFGHNKSHLVFYNSNLVQTDFFKDRPDPSGKYVFWVGRDLKNKDTTYSIENLQGIALTGQSGLGKTSLANVVLFGLDPWVREEHIFTKSKADYFNSSKTTFHYKDEEKNTLDVLRSLKARAISDQKKLDLEGRQNIYETSGKLTLLVFDEAHSYLKNSTSLPKEEREIRSEIIETVNWFLKQARSVGYICIFIMPNPEREQIDVNIRDVAYFFSTRISSEAVSQNIFKSPIASLIPPKMGLFVAFNGKETKVIQVPIIKWNRDL